MPKNHNLETFIKRTVEANTKWVLAEKKKLPQPIEELALWSEQGRLEVVAVLVRAGGKTHEIMHGDVPETSLPLNDADDELLEAFREEHELDEEDVDWGDYDGLPESIYRMEMIRAAQLVANKLVKAGVAFVPKAKVGIRIDDESYSNADEFAKKARQGLAKLGAGTAKALLAIYYKQPDKKTELLP